MEQMLTDIKGEIDGDAIIAGALDTPLTSIDKSSRQKIKQQRS